MALTRHTVARLSESSKIWRDKQCKELVKDLRAAESAARLTIRRALWGALYDVTTKVKRGVSNGKVNMKVNRDVFGEPAEGHRKQLYVLYSSAGQQDWEEVREHDDLVIET